MATGVVTAQQEFGNLLGPLDPLHVLGVWLNGDYRLFPTGAWTETRLLAGVVAGAFAIGAIAMLTRRSWAAIVFVGVSLFAYVYVTQRGSPWADGKAMTIVSPAIMFAAGLGVAFVHRLGQRWLAWGIAGLLAVGVLWTNSYQYHDVSLAPRDRMEELDQIGEEIAGEGPTLYTEFEEYGKHFLREAAPEGSSEGWQRRFAEAEGRDGRFPRFGFDNDTDQYTDDYLRYYRTIVLPRGFFGSRPPSTYERIHQGPYYDVWQRPADADDALIRHASLGDGRTPYADARCSVVRSIADDARAEGGRIAYAELPPVRMIVPAETALPPGWFPDTLDPALLQVRGQGLIEDSSGCRTTASWTIWVEGSLKRDWRVLVDGREVGTLRRGLEPRLGAHEVATVALPAGRHVVTLPAARRRHRARQRRVRAARPGGVRPARVLRAACGDDRSVGAGGRSAAARWTGSRPSASRGRGARRRISASTCSAALSQVCAATNALPASERRSRSAASSSRCSSAPASAATSNGTSSTGPSAPNTELALAPSRSTHGRPQASISCGISE